MSEQEIVRTRQMPDSAVHLPSEQKRIRAFVVSPYPVVRAGVRTMLEATQVTVVGEANPTEEALCSLQSKPADLVLIFAQIGEACGLDILRRIKERWPKLAVLILATSESPHHLSQALALGCSGYLLKRVHREELLKAIHALARGETFVDPALVRQVLEGGRTRRLSSAEVAVLRLVKEGKTNCQIAKELGYSLATVKSYVARVLAKLEATDRTQAAVKAVLRGVLD